MPLHCEEIHATLGSRAFMKYFNFYLSDFYSRSLPASLLLIFTDFSSCSASTSLPVLPLEGFNPSLARNIKNYFKTS